MKLAVKRCRTCGALGVGPHRVKLWPFEGRLYCRSDYKLALTWESSRDGVTMGIDNLYEYQRAALNLLKKSDYVGDLPVEVSMRLDWRGFIQEQADLAGWALAVDDRRTFVHYFSRAVWAWALKEDQDAVK